MPLRKLRVFEYLSKVIPRRSKEYGDPTIAMEAIGLAWTALIEFHMGVKLPKVIPARLVCAMYVAAKTLRTVTPGRYEIDDYADAINYTRLAEELNPCRTSDQIFSSTRNSPREGVDTSQDK